MWRDILNGKCRQVNNILEKLCVENNFTYVNYDNIKPRQHCSYRVFIWTEQVVRLSW